MKLAQVQMSFLFHNGFEKGMDLINKHTVNILRAHVVQFQ